MGHETAAEGPLSQRGALALTPEVSPLGFRLPVLNLLEAETAERLTLCKKKIFIAETIYSLDHSVLAIHSFYICDRIRLYIYIYIKKVLTALLARRVQYRIFQIM